MKRRSNDCTVNEIKKVIFINEIKNKRKNLKGTTINLNEIKFEQV